MYPRIYEKMKLWIKTGIIGGLLGFLVLPIASILGAYEIFLPVLNRFLSIPVILFNLNDGLLRYIWHILAFWVVVGNLTGAGIGYLYEKYKGW